MKLQPIKVPSRDGQMKFTHIKPYKRKKNREYNFTQAITTYNIQIEMA